MSNGVFQGIEAKGFIAGQKRILRAAYVVGLQKVMCQEGSKLVFTTGIELLQCLPYLKVIGTPLLSQDGTIGGFLGKRVSESVLELWFASGFEDQFDPLQRAEMSIQIICGPGDGLQNAVVKASADHGCQLKSIALLHLQPIHASGQQAL